VYRRGQAVELLAPKHPAAAALVEEAEADVLEYMAFTTRTAMTFTHHLTGTIAHHPR